MTAQNSTDSEISVTDLFAVFWRRRRLFGTCFIVLAILSGLYTLFVPIHPQYTFVRLVTLPYYKDYDQGDGQRIYLGVETHLINNLNGYYIPLMMQSYLNHSDYKHFKISAETTIGAGKDQQNSSAGTFFLTATGIKKTLPLFNTLTQQAFQKLQQLADVAATRNVLKTNIASTQQRLKILKSSMQLAQNRLSVLGAHKDNKAQGASAALSDNHVLQNLVWSNFQMIINQEYNFLLTLQTRQTNLMKKLENLQTRLNSLKPITLSPETAMSLKSASYFDSKRYRLLLLLILSAIISALIVLTAETFRKPKTDS